MIRVALIGTGFWAAKLAEALPGNELELAGCYSPAEERRAAFAERFGCTAVASFEEALESVDAVLLATPNDQHAEQAVAAAAAGKHVFTEKPIATTTADGERMRDACDHAGVTLLVGHELRYLGAARAAKRLVDEGALGTVVLAEANFSVPSRVKPGTWKSGGRGTPLVQLGIHHAETLQYLLGPVARTAGTLTHLVSDADIDDVGVATLEFESGALGTIVSSYVSPKTYWLRLSGTEAVLEYRTDMSVWPAAGRLDALTTLTVGGEQVDFDPVDPLRAELEAFAACIRGEATPEVGAQEGLRALKVILDAIATADAS
jgi:predicted dehydrogenase